MREEAAVGRNMAMEKEERKWGKKQEWRTRENKLFPTTGTTTRIMHTARTVQYSALDKCLDGRQV